MKSIYYYRPDTIASKLLLDRVSTVTNVEKIYYTVDYRDEITVLQRIMQQCKSKIKWFSFDRGFSYQFEENVLSPLVLANAHYVSMNSLYFYIKWTNKCKTLILHEIEDLSENWCNFVIKHSYVFILSSKKERCIIIVFSSNICVLSFVFCLSFMYHDR